MLRSSHAIIINEQHQKVLDQKPRVPHTALELTLARNIWHHPDADGLILRHPRFTALSRQQGHHATRTGMIAQLINYSNKGSNYIFELKNCRKIDRNIINKLKKLDISAIIK